MGNLNKDMKTILENIKNSTSKIQYFFGGLYKQKKVIIAFSYRS